MSNLDDLNQKVIIVVVFTGLLLLLWWFIKARLGNGQGLPGHGSDIQHIETRRLAHSSLVSLFDVKGTQVLILQSKQGASVIEIAPSSQRREVQDAPM